MARQEALPCEDGRSSLAAVAQELEAEMAGRQAGRQAVRQMSNPGDVEPVARIPQPRDSAVPPPLH